MRTKLKPFSLPALVAKNLPRCTLGDLGEVNMREGHEEEAARTLAAINQYLSAFVKPCPCLGCGAQLGAKDVTDSILGLIGQPVAAFTWGLAWGEGHCQVCGYPARAHHTIKDSAGGDPLMEMRNLILQYHPAELRLEPAKADGDP